MVAALGGPHRRPQGPVRDAHRLRGPRGQPGFGRSRPGPDRGAPGRAAGGGRSHRGLPGPPVPEPPLRPACGPWPAGPKATSTCWRAPDLRRSDGRSRRRPTRPRSPTPTHDRPIARSILMDIEVATLDTLPAGLVALGVPVAVRGRAARSWRSDPAAAGRPLGVPPALDAGWCKRHGFTGKVGQTLAVRAAHADRGAGEAGEPEADVILVGVGDALGARSGVAAPESLRRAAAAYVRAVGTGPGGGAAPSCRAGGSRRPGRVGAGRGRRTRRLPLRPLPHRRAARPAGRDWCGARSVIGRSAGGRRACCGAPGWPSR